MTRRQRRRLALLAFGLAGALAALVGALWSVNVLIVAGLAYLFYVLIRDELWAHAVRRRR